MEVQKTTAKVPSILSMSISIFDIHNPAIDPTLPPPTRDLPQLPKLWYQKFGPPHNVHPLAPGGAARVTNPRINIVMRIQVLVGML